MHMFIFNKYKASLANLKSYVTVGPIHFFIGKHLALYSLSEFPLTLSPLMNILNSNGKKG